MNKQLEDIRAIREMMEKSSKFQAINGLSLVFAGVIALIGAGVAYKSVFCSSSFSGYSTMQHVIFLLADALIVLMLAVGVITLFSWQKAKKNKLSLFNKVTMRTAYNLCIPLAAGGIFSLVLLFNGHVEYVASTTLIFYGLALINASRYTVGEIHILGICEVITGLLAAVYLFHGIYWWAIGFGVCHIIFGLIMYFKYDKV